jgi:hypothetical protein
MILCAVVLALVTTAAGATGAQLTPRPPDSLPQGATAYALLPDSSDNIRSAIDRTVARMNFITRPIARSRLSKVNPTPHQLHVVMRPDSVSVAFDDGNPVVTPLNGDTVDWSNPLTHEIDRAHAAVAGDTVRQILAAPDGERENALIFLDSGARVRLRVTVRSHRLPRPLVYDLVFRRDGTGQMKTG